MGFSPFLGLVGLIVLKAIFVGLLFIFLEKILKKKITLFPLRLAILLAVFLLIKERLLVRPEFISAFCFGFLIYLLQEQVPQKTKTIAIPILLIFWFNFHAAALAGLFYLCVWSAGDFLESFFQKRKKSDSISEIKELFLPDFIQFF